MTVCIIFLDIAFVVFHVIIPLVLVGHDLTTAKSGLHALLTIYHLIFNACSWNNNIVNCMCGLIILLIYITCNHISRQIAIHS